MSIRAGRYTFSHVTYDPPSDVLYAAIGRPRPGRRVETPESHYLRFDSRDRFSGIIFMNPRDQLDREGAVYVSLPEGIACGCRGSRQSSTAAFAGFRSRPPLPIMFSRRRMIGAKMNIKRKTPVAMGVVALAVPVAAFAKPGGGHGNGGGNGHGNGGNAKVGYVFKGTFGGSGLVAVEKGNRHVRKADLAGQDVQFDLSTAKLRVADVNGDGQVTLDDVASGDRVQVKARLGRKDAGAKPFDAGKLIDKSHPAKPAEQD